MELILNDLSLRGQFTTIDDFEDYYVDYLKCIIDFVKKEQIPFYKKSDTYNRMIVKGVSLEQYLREASNQPVATMIKKAIVEMAYCEPYWDMDDMQSRIDIEYKYPDKQGEPNCFTEAIERKCPIVSMREDKTLKTKITCYRDNELVEITDITDIKTLLDAYLQDDIKNVRVVMENYPVGKKINCAELSGRCYTEEALLDNNLSMQDVQKFVMNIQTLIQDKSSGRKSHWWDNIKEDICEYRLSISDGRELRILFQWGEALTFLNGFIKKTEKTPKWEIALAEKIKKN